MCIAFCFKPFIKQKDMQIQTHTHTHTQDFRYITEYTRCYVTALKGGDVQ